MHARREVVFDLPFSFIACMFWVMFEIENGLGCDANCKSKNVQVSAVTRGGALQTL